MTATVTTIDARRRQRILSYKDLASQKGIRFSRVWISKLIKAGKFPKPLKLGSAAIGFVEDEIDQWIVERIRQRDADFAEHR